MKKALKIKNASGTTPSVIMPLVFTLLCICVVTPQKSSSLLHFVSFKFSFCFVFLFIEFNSIHTYSFSIGVNVL